MRSDQPKYWCQRTLQVDVAGPKGERSVAVAKPFALVGSHPRADIVLSGSGVARRHLYLHATERGVYCVDLAKSQARKSQVGSWHTSSKPIRVGRHQLMPRLIGVDPTLPAEDVDLLAGGSGGQPYAMMTVSADGHKVGEHRLTRRLHLIGRNQACTLRLTTRSLSDFHCVLARAEDKFWIIDLQSTRKTIVDGSPVEVAGVDEQSQLVLGRVHVRLRFPWIQKPSEPEELPPAKDLAHFKDIVDEDSDEDASESVELELIVEDKTHAGIQDQIRSDGGPSQDVTVAERREELADRAAQLEADYSQLTRDRLDFEQQVERWKAGSDAQQAEFKEQSSTLAESRRQLEIELERMAAVTSQIEDRERRLLAWQEELEQSGALAAAKRDQSAAEHQQTEQQRREQEALQDSLSKESERLADLQRDLDAQAERLLNEQQQVEEKRKQLDQRVIECELREKNASEMALQTSDQQRRERLELSGLLEQLGQERDQLRKLQAHCKSELSHLHDQRESLNNDLQQIEQSKKLQEDQRVASLEDVKRQRQQLAEDREKLRFAQAEADDLRKSLELEARLHHEQGSEVVSELQRTLETRSLELDETQRQMESLKRQIEALEADTREKEKTQSLSAEELVTLRLQHGELQTAYEHALEELAESQARRTVLEETRQQLGAQFHEKHAECQRLASELADATQAKGLADKQLVEQADRLQELSSEAEDQTRVLQADLDSLTRQLEDEREAAKAHSGKTDERLLELQSELNAKVAEAARFHEATSATDTRHSNELRLLQEQLRTERSKNTAAEQNISDLQGGIEALHEERQAFEESLAQLKSQLEDARRDNEKLAAENQELVQAGRELKERAAGAEKSLSELRSAAPQGNTEIDKLAVESALQEKEAELQEREAKLRADEERLELQREELERYLRVEATQRRVIENLGSLRKEKKTPRFGRRASRKDKE